MRAVRAFLLTTLIGCGVQYETTVDPMLPPADGTPAFADMRCAGVPDAGPSTSWRHLTSRYVSELGESHHRGLDLIATTADDTQAITGKLAYSDLDKDLEDEDVEVFACLESRWQPIGDARTDDDGYFTLTLAGDERLPIGMRDLYFSVAGDRTGSEFIGLVAPPGSPVVVSDVDGTLTASENAYPLALGFGGDVAVQADAPATLMSAAMHGVSIVYVTARGDRFTQDTRDWFTAKGFPRGPMRLPRSLVTMPGEDTIEFKTNALASVAGFDVLAGFGNRITDVAAYTAAGLSPNRIFIKLPEFTDELTADLMANKATGFELYDVVRTEQLAALMP